MTRAAAGRSWPRATSKNKSSAADENEKSAGDDYFLRSERPLTNLMFLLPLLAAYELGTRQYVLNPILAFSMMQQFFALFGATGRYMPAMAVVGILIAWHIARRDPLRVRWGDLWKMAIESILLAVPLFVVWAAAVPYLAKLPLFASPVSLGGWAVPCIGAGIYEELVFRLIVMNLLSLLLVDGLKLPKTWTSCGIVVLSAVMFSGYHYLGSEKFTYITFVFRTLAGLYFATVYLCRGFGITCGSHVAYDLIVIGLRVLR